MKMMLAENIRVFRKERSLTQEQLSEALGVTAGAVYKWETNLSIPDLKLIIRMADFFDVSELVTTIIGYMNVFFTAAIMLPCRRSWFGGPGFFWV